MCGFDGVRRGSYFGEEPNGRTELQVRLGKLNNGKATGNDEVKEEMIKGSKGAGMDGTVVEMLKSEGKVVGINVFIVIGLFS